MAVPPPGLVEAQRLELGGRLAEAERQVADVIAAAKGEPAVLADALRRLARIRYRQHGADAAMELLERSYQVADAAGHDVLAAEALNAFGVLDLERGTYESARAAFERASRRAVGDAGVRALTEQNLGIIANIQGDWQAALTHYARSAAAFRAADDERGCAIALHNLGMLSVDRQLWEVADRYFEQSLEGATAAGDVHLRGLCLLNRSDVHVALGRYEDALRDVEAALPIFERFGARANTAGAYRVLGAAYRKMGATELAEERLRAAMALAAEAGSGLNEADAARELALLYQALGRSRDALKCYHAAHGIFSRLDARVDAVDVATRMEALEASYMTLIRDWGQSIESADSYTHGHCERVAVYAVSVADALGLDDEALMAVRLGAYLHDVGKIRIAPEILNKPGRLTEEEVGLMRQHTLFGVELLADVEFPWDVKPIIRSHHERVDGTGYPDGLRDDEIPLTAQIVCIADVYDALTTTRSYRPALTRDEAVAEMHACRRWWRPAVFDAFLSTIPAAFEP